MKPVENFSIRLTFAAAAFFLLGLVTSSMAATPTGNSLQPSLDADGSHLAFTSTAPDLTRHYYRGRNVYLLNRKTDSINVLGRQHLRPQAKVEHFNPSISPDGRFVAYQSRTAAIGFDQDSQDDIFLADTQTGGSKLISMRSDNTASGSGKSIHPIFSPDGRFVLFTSFAEDLTANDRNGKADLFVYELESESLRLLSKSPLTGESASGTPGLHAAENPMFSQNGEFVVFESQATDLAEQDRSPDNDIYLYAIETGAIELISMPLDEEETESSDAHSSVVNADGRFIVYKRRISSNNSLDTEYLLRDRESGTTETVPVWGPITANGRYIGFGPGLRWDRQQDRFQPAPAEDFLAPKSHLPPGEEPTIARSVRRFARMPLMSPNGRHIAFLANFSAPDTPSNRRASASGFQLYLRDFEHNRTLLVSSGRSRDTGDRHDIMRPTADANWTTLVFQSRSGRLVEGDFNNHFDLFAFNIRDSGTTLLSRKRAEAGIPRPRLSLSVQPDGLRISWRSRSVAPAAPISVIPTYQLLQSPDLEAWHPTGIKIEGGVGIPEERIQVNLSPDRRTFYRAGFKLPSFANQELAGTVLRESNLKNQSFDQSQLQEAVFDRAQLRHASFRQSQLRLAHFRQVSADDIVLKAANLSGALFLDAQLTRADFRSAQAVATQLIESNLNNAQLEGIRAPGSRWTDSALHNADFADALLKNANFSGCQAQSASFGNADLRGASFQNTTLTDPDFTNADLSHVDFLGASLHSPKFDGAKFSNTRMPDGTVRDKAP